MSRPFPYTFISCPCANTPVPDPSKKRRSRESPQKNHPDKARSLPQIDYDEDEQTFDPRSARSNFSLYPPEQLLYCEDCHQIKCPRCITEEILVWYCPSCLFETPSSMVRSEGNRCARNCFNCPACTAPLAVTTLENATGGGGSQQGPWVLACGYCMWTTLDIGIKFDKPTNIRAQLGKMTADISTSSSTPDARTRERSKSYAELKSPLSMWSSIDEQFPPHGESRAPSQEATTDAAAPSNSTPRSPEGRFAALKAFYKNSLDASTAYTTESTDFGAPYSSPTALARLMSMYTQSRLNSFYGTGGRKPKPKPPLMREALTASEGLSVPAPDSEATMIQRMVSEDCGWDGLASIEQRMWQSADARFVEDLLPLPSLLRTKRAKRCKSCKHILVKPEFKPQSTRFRIRLIALSYIPLPMLRPLVLPPTTSSSYPTPSITSPSSSAPNLDALPPLKPIQLLLTLKNHMFDPVRITLATPSVTPGRVASKVTILCPQFDIGANSDVWDEALQNAPPASEQRSSRTGPYERVPEAGKVWDKGRNWTTVVLEVVPGTLPGYRAEKKRTGDETGNYYDDGDDGRNDDGSHDDGANTLDWSGQSTDPGQQLQPDEDVLEIPVFVRMEFDSESQMEQDQGAVGRGPNADTVKKELAYWMVLGVGRIQPT